MEISRRTNLVVEDLGTMGIENFNEIVRDGDKRPGIVVTGKTLKE